MTSLMALDLTAAFDMVDHKLLGEKLLRYNIGPTAREWIRDFLVERTQYVTLGRNSSSMHRVCQGVPQGSVAGPLLYAIYVNEITEVVKTQGCQNQSHLRTDKLFGEQCRDCGVLTIYADDSTYSISNRDRNRNQMKLTENLKLMEMFLEDNKLVLNIGKTAITEFMIKQKRGRTGGQPPSLIVKNEKGENELIKDKNSIRILGANLQNNLLWNSHVETGPKALFPRIRKQLGRLRNQGQNIPLRSRRTLANSLLAGSFNYILPLWGTTTKVYIRKAQTILNSAARWASGCGRRTKTKRLMETMNWLTIEEQIKMTTAVLTWKMVYHRIPPRILSKMEISQDMLIRTTEPRLEFTSKCLRWKAAELWNSLDQELRFSPNISTFKRLMRRHILLQRPQEPD